MQQTKIKTIDINGREWFDKANGNSYFSAIATINYGMPDEININIPFQYGYGDTYKYEAFKELKKAGHIPEYENNMAIGQYYQQNNIIARHNMQRNCLKRDVKNFTY